MWKIGDSSYSYLFLFQFKHYKKKNEINKLYIYVIINGKLGQSTGKSNLYAY